MLWAASDQFLHDPWSLEDRDFLLDPSLFPVLLFIFSCIVFAVPNTIRCSLKPLPLNLRAVPPAQPWLQAVVVTSIALGSIVER